MPNRIGPSPLQKSLEKNLLDLCRPGNKLAFRRKLKKTIAVPLDKTTLLHSTERDGNTPSRDVQSSGYISYSGIAHVIDQLRNRDKMVYRAVSHLVPFKGFPYKCHASAPSVLLVKQANRQNTQDERPSQQPAGSRGYIRGAVEASLRRLRVDYIDVYQIHRPDPDTPAEETMSALHDLVIEGKVRYIGCSNYGGWQIAESNGITQGRGWTPFVSSQPAYNVLNRRAGREHIPACEHYGLGVIPWGPLAGGFLTGKYRRDEPFPEGTRMATNEWARPVLTERNWDRLEQLENFAQGRGITITELALAWLAAQQAVATIIVGATHPAQVRENARASEHILSANDLVEINNITR